MTSQGKKKSLSEKLYCKAKAVKLHLIIFWIVFFVTNLQGSKDQLKEVWEEADGLDPNEFDPKTFFKLHGKRFSLI